MATAAQFAANRRNAEKSTGPRTPEGKARVAQNAVTLGLYGRYDNFPADTKAQDIAIAQALLNNLAPSGPLEESLAAEILRACRRLDRCAQADYQIATGPVNDLCDYRQPGIDRARVAAERSRDRAIAQLRRLQTERALRETYSKGDLPELPSLAEQSQVLRGLPGDRLWQLLTGTAADDYEHERIVRRELSECELDLAQLKLHEQAIANADRAGSGPKPDNLEGARRGTCSPETANSKIAEQSQFSRLPETQDEPTRPQSPATAPGTLIETPVIPRGAPCPCGSGLKYKRCCGRFVAPVLAGIALSG
jgi:hypothetical protein